MKIKLSKPEYKLDYKDLEKNKAFIRGQQGNKLIRRRIPLFMDGYRYAAAGVKKRWNIDFAFFEAGFEQVKPCYLPGKLNEQGATIWWRKMNQDKNFANKLIKEILGIVKVEKNLAKSIPQRELSAKEIEKFIMAHLEWWIKFFEIAYLWFGVDNIKEKVDEEIKKYLAKNKNQLNNFLESVYRPMKLPLSSVEQRDLLKLYKLKGQVLEAALKKHTKKYQHLSLHNIDDECFDIAYYRGRLDLFKKDNEYQKTKTMLSVADKEIATASQLIKKSKLPASLKQKINFVRWFMYIRTETIDHMMLVNNAYKIVFSSLAKIFSLPVDALLHMTYEEIISSLQQKKLTISREKIFDRLNNGYAFLITTPPYKSYLVVGEEIDKLDKFIIPNEDNRNLKELKGQIAFKGKVRGVARVILDRRDADQLKAGEILVTTMTAPNLVPAMKISNGIITNEGGVLCHAAIMSRELRKPCIIGTKIATDVIKTGQIIELDADRGIIILK